MPRRYLFAGFALIAIAALSLLVIGNGERAILQAPLPELPVQLVQFDNSSPIRDYIALIDGNTEQRVAALQSIKQNWSDGQAVMLVEMAMFTRRDQTNVAILNLLSAVTGQKFGSDLDQWYHWIWNQELTPFPHYAQFKAWLYSRLDVRFAEYFSDEKESTIRLDEIRWGGVFRDGIPPLKNPETIAVADATYLADSDVVFGVEFGGQARAYPKRILAWHEMVKDVVGGQSINGVFCTLCGSMIVYETDLAGKHYELGTSGFLYRSNKLMYDHETKSMWSTLAGEPVVGPLVGKGIKLEPLYVVTTTWGKWKQLHPTTDVLSLRTGHRRDYGEGVAYHDYFATDELMFKVPQLDTRLKNKEEVLIVRGNDDQPLAIDTTFLSIHRVYHDAIGVANAPGQLVFVVLTDESGANRVYETKGNRIERWVDDETVIAADGKQWRITEDALILVDRETPAVRLDRVSAHRAFWFGWSSAFPTTRLVK